ncbi:MAG: hypothetical protein J5610_02180 [Prevotella sp.]|nr:hypothetical protein [Prevotella sp.]
MKKLFTTILACMAATTIIAQNYGTYYNSAFDVTLPSGVAAYIVTGMNNDRLTYQKIADGAASHKTVPAGTAVLLDKASENIGEVNPNFTNNLLHGSDTKTTTYGGEKYYKLTYGNDGITFGWFWGASGGAAFESPAHKAWLALPAAAVGANIFLGLPGDDDATGIATLENKQQKTDNVWYDLNGRRISAPKTKGIYVKNGCKMVIK